MKTIKTYKKYYGKYPKKKIKKNLTFGKDLFIIGNIETIVYNTNRFGEVLRFAHNFKKNVILTDGNNLIIPNVKITKRGIE